MNDCVRKRGVGANAGASEDASDSMDSRRDIVIRYFACVWVIKSWVEERCLDTLRDMPWNIRLRGRRV